MKIKSCSFAGHRDIYNSSVKSDIYNLIKTLVLKENVKVFYVGKYGDFDKYAVGELKKLKIEFSDIEINLVIPYLTSDMDKKGAEEFDNVIIAPIVESTPAKYRIIKANEYMIDNSDFLVCYISHDWGGAARTMKYAQKRRKVIINLFNKKTSVT